MPTKTGQMVRMSRLIDPRTGRGFCVAFDHALQLGTCPGLERPEATLDLMAEAGVDGVILPLGTALRLGGRLARRGGPALILRLDQTTMWREGTQLAYPDGITRLVASVADAVALGADAVVTYLFVGHNDPALETRSFEDNARVNEAARAAGMPHIIETMAARGGLAADAFDPDVVTFHTRVGVEMGADIIKTDWPGSVAALRAITAALPVPVMLAGGPRQDSDRGTLQLVAQIMQAGAAGILFGRSIFQARQPLAVMKACRAIIHDGTSVEEAMAAAGI
ncbi:Fructose-bisphosphate aldolase [Rhodovastum atsumiense]|uniref:Fructose-bisphosphate aldolase n=1 Tax=Rhodovastum atsumiense TaxID=504468 RepID=A0A5M6IWD4_9PROT|nr:fructose-bisphosphate aldolase [Rhodovastum atsumiense]KAA5612634.1 fructose-bisphosphate aldolase [Rhodovastum atsumiense]CAH2601261.1 Fructose-bisphosphate aldolase [Rhodovastum atsumiense]